MATLISPVTSLGMNSAFSSSEPNAWIDLALNEVTPQSQLRPARLDDRAAPLAAVLLVDADAEEAGRRQVVPELAREVRAVVVLVPLELVGLELGVLGLDPVAHGAPEVVLLAAEPEVHAGPPLRRSPLIQTNV